MSPSKKGKIKRGSEWGYANRTERGMKAILIYISGESHSKLKQQAFLEERSLQKVARRVIEEGIKNLGLPEKK
jgi:hypothetical protein